MVSTETVAENGTSIASGPKDEECPMDNDYDVLIDEMAESIDLTRENAKLDSVSSYVVVSILTATSCFGTVGNFATTQSIDLFQDSLHFSVVLTASIGALSGIYSTVVFSLCSIVSYENSLQGVPFQLALTEEAIFACRLSTVRIDSNWNATRRSIRRVHEEYTTVSSQGLQLFPNFPLYVPGSIGSGGDE